MKPRRVPLLLVFPTTPAMAAAARPAGVGGGWQAHPRHQPQRWRRRSPLRDRDAGSRAAPVARRCWFEEGGETAVTTARIPKERRRAAGGFRVVDSAAALSGASNAAAMRWRVDGGANPVVTLRCCGWTAATNSSRHDQGCCRWRSPFEPCSRTPSATPTTTEVLARIAHPLHPSYAFAARQIPITRITEYTSAMAQRIRMARAAT